MKKSVWTFIGGLLLAGVLGVVAYFGADFSLFQIPSASDGIRLGLDLVGGSAITYEADLPADYDMSNLEDDLSSAESMLRSRLTSFGYTESNVTRGGNRLLVEIPAVSDPYEIAELMGQPGRLEFRDADDNVVVEGSRVKKAEAKFGPTTDNGVSQWHVVLTFDSDGQEAFRVATKDAASRADGENFITITLDGEIQSQPSVESKYSTNGIDSESCTITMGASNTTQAQKEAKNLADIINSGKLPFALTRVSLRTIGAQLGERSLQTSLIAGAIGLGLVILFMIVFYAIPGFASAISLMFYSALMVIILSVSHVNLSLPGIAGIILSIGMAVDANVIIFERVKEELRSGKTLRSSIESGYKRALTAIIDSNITTIIAASVLLIFGTGTVVGFAVTLLIGVLLSMFTVLVISRMLLLSLVGMKITNLKLYGVR